MTCSRVSLGLLTSVLLLSVTALAAEPEREPRRAEAGVVTAEADTATGSARQRSSTLDPVRLAEYVDGFVTARMKAHGAVGVTVSVVHDGRIVFARGYGFDDLAARRPVDADRSLFRPGSISKTFTWTAVMQLVEQGRLDLDADIRTYLPDLEIPSTFSEPITLLHLMAHTPGFEDSAMGHLFVDRPDAVQPLLAYLQTHRPARVRPPGTLPAYSNYGTALAGLIVARVSGMPFEDYVDRHLLEPLGMHHSTFREPWGKGRVEAPMPEALRANVSRGYLRIAGTPVAGGFEFIGQVGPAGALSTTASDMGRWMLAHLRDGELGGVRILRPETAAAMHRQHFTPAPGMPGMAHGFIESSLGGYRALGHGGGTVYFISDMQLVPELGLGVFISTNTSGTGGLVVQEFATSLVERYFPGRGASKATAGPPTTPEAVADARARLAEYAGNYLTTRRSHTTVERLVASQATRVAVADDGTLLINGPTGPGRWVETGSDRFSSRDTGEPLAFVRDAEGRVAYFVPSMPVFVMEKVGPLAAPANLYLLMALATAVLACVPVGAWLRRNRPPPQTVTERRAGALLVLTAVLWLIAIALANVGLAPILEDFSLAFFGFPNGFFRAGLGVGVLAAGLTLVSGLLLYPVWRAGLWPFWRRMRHTLATGFALTLLVVLWDLNAIGFRFMG